jgi:peptidoglycan/LPS O-acetylase OafA/YrhL
MKKDIILDQINLLKGYAIILIVLHHFIRWHQKDNWFFSIIHQGSYGVDIFIAISGFTLMVLYKNKNNWTEFYIRRFTKIYPALWVSMAVFAIWFAITGLKFPELKNIGLTATGLSFLLTNWTSAFLGDYWFISLIITCYLLFPIFLKIIKKINNQLTLFLLIFIFSFLISEICKTEFLSGKSRFYSNIMTFFVAMYLAYLWSGKDHKKLKLFNMICIPSALIFSATLLLDIKSLPGLGLMRPFFASGILLFTIFFLSDKNIILNNRIISFLSLFSFEIYILNDFNYNTIWDPFFNSIGGKNLLSYSLYFILLPVLALGLNKLTELVKEVCCQDNKTHNSH